MKEKFDKKRLNQQFNFIKEIDKEKFIERQTLLTDKKGRENDAEHAWHIAIMAILLKEYANEEIDLLKTVSMLLIHDLVEIYAGDTYAYDSENKKTQKEREDKAANKIFGLLPKDQRKEFFDLWNEFEKGDTMESKFAHAMDNIQPTMLNDATDGQMWLDNKVKLSQILKRNEKTNDASSILWSYSYENFISKNVKKGKIQDDVSTQKKTHS